MQVLGVKAALAVVFGLWAGAAWAQTAPKADATVCSVTGMIHAVMQEEMVNPVDKKHVLVPVVVLEIAAVAPLDANYKGDFCNKVSAPAADGGKPMGYYRLCDSTAEFMTGQTVRGVVGLSMGGGRYCIAQIQVLPPK